MPFTPPTHGYEESHISHTIHDHLFPNNCCYAVTSPSNLSSLGISEGDVVIVDRSAKVQPKSVVLIRIESDTFIVQLHKGKDAWFAINDDRKGKMTDEVQVIGVVTNVIKDHLT